MKLSRKILIAGMHVLGWAIILLIPKYLMHQALFKVHLLQEFSMWIPVIIIFYLNYYLFIPRLLTNKKFIPYFGALVFMIVISFFSIKIFDRYYFEPRFFPPSFERAYFLDSLGQEPFKGHVQIRDSIYHGRRDTFRRRFMNGEFPLPPGRAGRAQIHMMRKEIDIFVLLILSIAVSTSIKITGKWYSNEKERKEMENQKLMAELSLLKSQINPHFFFNTLNSIYSLAIQKSTRTPEAIVKLSELMRYIIYEADKNLVPLKKELEYIQNFVELQKLRLNTNVNVIFSIEGIYNDIMIEPLLFLPFIENAFKHGIDSTRDCEIKINFVIVAGQLIFKVENQLVQKGKLQPTESSGIGLSNTQKRLELLYPNNHNLKIMQTDKHFNVELSLKLRDYELHNSR